MRRRLLLSSLALTLAALLALALPLAVAVRGLLERRAMDALQGSVEQFALLVDTTSRSCSEVQLRVAQVEGLPTTITVVTTRGTVLATTAPRGDPRIGRELAAARTGRVGREVAAGRIAVAVPLATAVCGNPLVLHAAEPDAALHGQIRGAWASIAGIVVVVAGGAAGGAWLLGRRLSRPFETLATSARQLGEGDFSTRSDRSGLAEADAIADALDDSADRLGRALARSTAFAADASHQLRTPLTALRLHLEAAPDPDQASIRDALEELDRLEETIEDLTALTRVDGPDEDVDLCALIEQWLPAWRAVAAERGRELDTDLAVVPRLRIRPAAVSQAMQVLVDNALDHGRGRVTIAAGPARPDANGAVRVCVTDEGAAADTTDRTARPGGRGLPLARALIAAEGGQLTITSDHRGTVACLLLPGP